MSSLLLCQLRPIKSIFKSKGLDCEMYGLIKDGVLYFNNGYIAIKIPIDIPFNCYIHLHQLYTILQAVKSESVIVYQNNIVSVKCDDVLYKIDSMPFDPTQNLNFINFNAEIECDKPFVFNQMMKIAENFLAPTIDENNLRHGVETLLVYNNNIFCTDVKNIIQAKLDFGMPNCSFELKTIYYYNKLAKYDIVAMGFVDNILAIKFTIGLTVYMKSKILPVDKSQFWYDKLQNVINKYWINTTVTLPDCVKKQFAILSKLNHSNVIYFNRTFCQSKLDKIEYPQFTQDDIQANLLVKQVRLLIDKADTIQTCTEGVSFMNDNKLIRGFLMMVCNED